MTSGIQAGAVTAITKLLDRTMRTGIRWLLVALLAPCAMAQTPEQDLQRERWRQQEEQRQEEYRRSQELMQRQQKSAEDERRKTQQQYDDERKKQTDEQWQKDAPKRQAQAAQNAQNAADMKAARTKLLAMPPLPDERNPLLGRWRVESSGKPQRKDEVGLLMGMLANPGGITEFKPKSWASTDGHGDDSLGPIAYRGDARRVWAIPAKGIELMGFDVADSNRAVSVNLDGCTLVRVAAVSTTATTPPQSATAAGAVVDGAAFRCTDGSLLHVSMCQGGAAQASCTLTELHRPGVQMGRPVLRADIAARVKACEAGGIRYGADDKPVFVR